MSHESREICESEGKCFSARTDHAIMVNNIIIVLSYKAKDVKLEGVISSARLRYLDKEMKTNHAEYFCLSKINSFPS